MADGTAFTPDQPSAAPAITNQRVLNYQRTHAKLLDTARELFAVERYETVTMRGLAGAAKMSTGAIFAHWSCKAEVWREAMECEPPVDSDLTRAAPGLLKAAVFQHGIIDTLMAELITAKTDWRPTQQPWWTEFATHAVTVRQAGGNV